MNRAFKIALLVVLIVLCIAVYPYALFTPEQRSLRPREVGKVCFVATTW